MPQIGQKVRVQGVTDYRSEIRDDRITPTYYSMDAGEPEKPLFVTVTPHQTKPGIGVVKHFTTDREKASKVKHRINEIGFAKLQARDNRLWEQPRSPRPKAAGPFAGGPDPKKR